MLKKQKGISIIEVLIALIITTIVTAATLSLFSNALDTSRQLTGTAKLDQLLNNTVEIIARDIQRAGYNTNATTSATNPFFSGTDDVSVGGSSDCVTFSYQVDATTSPTTSVNRFGYRLSGGAVQYRTSAAGANPCAASGWENVTDPNIITISAFTVTLNTTNINPSTGSTTTSTATITSYRSVTITITGNLVGSSSVSRTITRTIKIFNNKYTT